MLTHFNCFYLKKHFAFLQMTLMGGFDWNGLVAVDRLMAQILCGSYFALAGVVCMNLYIALLSDTFARVYGQAKATAVMQQAKTVITLEGKLSKFYRSKYAHFFLRECSPQVCSFFFYLLDWKIFLLYHHICTYVSDRLKNLKRKVLFSIIV